jgi:hypothetical protein
VVDAIIREKGCIARAETLPHGPAAWVQHAWEIQVIADSRDSRWWPQVIGPSESIGVPAWSSRQCLICLDPRGRVTAQPVSCTATCTRSMAAPTSHRIRNVRFALERSWGRTRVSRLCPAIAKGERRREAALSPVSPREIFAGRRDRTYILLSQTLRWSPGAMMCAAGGSGAGPWWGPARLDAHRAAFDWVLDVRSSAWAAPILGAAAAASFIWSARVPRCCCSFLAAAWDLLRRRIQVPFEVSDGRRRFFL